MFCKFVSGYQLHVRSIKLNIKATAAVGYNLRYSYNLDLSCDQTRQTVIACGAEAIHIKGSNLVHYRRLGGKSE